jgi:carbamoyl-phosphate synthase/aspartate carbamoyltransferase
MLTPPLLNNQNDYNEDIDEELKNPSDKRVFAIANAFHAGRTVDEVWELTRIDKWFLQKLYHIIETEKIIA